MTHEQQLLREIRDILAEGLERGRRREEKNDVQIKESLELQRASSRLYRRVASVALLLMVGAMAFLLFKA